MSPELKKMYNIQSEINFNPEKSDIFSLGITYIRAALLLESNDLIGLNDENGEDKVKNHIKNI